MTPPRSVHEHPARPCPELRRSAVRNLERSGVSRSVAMKITEHDTESVSRRYAIVSDAALKEAALKLVGTCRAQRRVPG